MVASSHRKETTWPSKVAVGARPPAGARGSQQTHPNNHFTLVLCATQFRCCHQFTRTLTKKISDVCHFRTVEQNPSCLVRIVLGWNRHHHSHATKCKTRRKDGIPQLLTYTNSRLFVWRPVGIHWRKRFLRRVVCSHKRFVGNPIQRSSKNALVDAGDKNCNRNSSFFPSERWATETFHRCPCSRSNRGAHHSSQLKSRSGMKCATKGPSFSRTQPHVDTKNLWRSPCHISSPSGLRMQRTLLHLINVTRKSALRSSRPPGESSTKPQQIGTTKEAADCEVDFM